MYALVISGLVKPLDVDCCTEFGQPGTNLHGSKDPTKHKTCELLQLSALIFTCKKYIVLTLSLPPPKMSLLLLLLFVHLLCTT